MIPTLTDHIPECEQCFAAYHRTGEYCNEGKRLMDKHTVVMVVQHTKFLEEMKDREFVEPKSFA